MASKEIEREIDDFAENGVVRGKPTVLDVYNRKSAKSGQHNRRRGSRGRNGR